MIIKQARRKLRRNNRVSVDDIVRFYRERKGSIKIPFGRHLSVEEFTLTNTPGGLGDCIMMTDIEWASRRATAWITSSHFTDVMALNPFHRPRSHPLMVSLSAMQATYDLGPGHNFQRIRRMFGLPVNPNPKGCLIAPVKTRKRKLISFHLNPGPHANDQKRTVHPRAREIYPETKAALVKFVKALSSTHDFIEVGGNVLEGHVLAAETPTIANLAYRLSQCVLHVGIISGPYHLAHALGVRTVCIINFPAPWNLMLPVVKNVDIVEAEWLYPQSHILHQEYNSRHWPKVSAKSLEAAFNREVYPYDDPTRFLEMVSA